MQKLRSKQSIIPTLRQLSSNLNHSNMSYKSLPYKSPPHTSLHPSHHHHIPPPHKKKQRVFQIPSAKQNHTITISEFYTTFNHKESIKHNLNELDEMKRTYSNVCQERRKYIDIMDWLKFTLVEVGGKTEGSVGELKNIYSTALNEMIKESKVENSQKSRLLRLLWESIMNINHYETKTLQDKLANIQSEIYNRYKLERQEYDKEIKEYRDRIMENAADLAQKQRFFYEVVTDNRVLRNRLKKVMNRLKHQLESNNYLKEQNIIFYKENEKMKMVLDSQDLDVKYKVLQQKFDILQKQFKIQKKKITKVNIIKELDEDQMRHKLGIKEEVDLIIRRVDVDDLLDLEIVETPKVEELARLYYTAGIQTETNTHDRSTNTPSVFAGKKAVAIQCGGYQRSKYFSYYRCQEISFQSMGNNLSGELLAAYREKNMQLKGDIRMREQMQRTKDRGLSSQQRSFKKIIISPPAPTPTRQLTRTKSRKRTVSPTRFIQAASEFVNRLNDQNKDEIKSRTSQASRRSQQVDNKIDSEKQESIIKPLRRSTQRTTQLLAPVRSTMKKNSAVFGESPRKSKISRIMKIDNILIQESLMKETLNEQPSLPESQIKTGELQSDVGEFYEEYTTARLEKNSLQTGERESKLKYKSERNSYFEEQFLLDVYYPEATKNISINSSAISKDKQERKSMAKRQAEYEMRIKRNSHRKSMTAESLPVEETDVKRRSNQQTKEPLTKRKDIQQKPKIQQQPPLNIRKRQSRIDKQKLVQKSILQNQLKSKVELPTISSRISQAPTSRIAAPNINKIQQRQSQSEISSNLSFCNVIEAKKREIPEQRRYSRFSSLNMDKTIHQDNIQQLTKFQMALIKNQTEESEQLPSNVDVTQTFLKRIIHTITKQIFQHRQNIILHQIIFQQFLNSIIDRLYGIGALSIDIKLKIKSSLLHYQGENRQKLSFKYLLEGKQAQSDYKRYLFVLYTLCSQFQTLYTNSDNYMQLLTDFIKDLLSNFFPLNHVNNFIKSNIITKSAFNKNQLFLLLKLFIDSESYHHEFVQTLYKLRLSVNNKNSICLKEFYNVVMIVENNSQIVSVKFREIVQYCNKNSRRIPVFKLVLLLKKLGWMSLLRLETALNAKYSQRYGVSVNAGNNATTNYKLIEEDLSKMSTSQPNNKYLISLESIKGDLLKENNLLFYYFIKLMFSSEIIDSVSEEVMGVDLANISKLFLSLSQQSIFGK